MMLAKLKSMIADAVKNHQDRKLRRQKADDMKTALRYLRMALFRGAK